MAGQVDKSGASAAPFNIRWQPGADQPWIPMIETTGNLIVIPVRVNGQELPAVVDTGSVVTLIDTNAAKQIGLVPGMPVSVTALGGNGKAAVAFAPVASFGVGGFAQTGGMIGIGDFTSLRQASPQRFSIILGMDALSGMAIDVDFDNRRVKLQPSGARPPMGPAPAPIALKSPGRAVTAVTVRGGAVESVIVDTGSNGEFTLTKRRWTSLPHEQFEVTDLASAGLGGIHVEPYLRLPTFAVGEAKASDIPTTIADHSLEAWSDGTIGIGFLRRFNVYLDPRAGVLQLAPRREAVPPVAVTMTGIQGSARDDGLTIVHVMANSPAAAAGLKQGDRICAVDGDRVSAAWVGTARNDWGHGPAGKRAMLTMCDGRTIPLTLKVFY